MKIHTRTLLILGATIFILIFAMVFLAQFFILSSYAQLEQAEASVNVERVSDQIAFERENLQAKILDWAIWDDTYGFMADRNPEYIRSNFGQTSAYEGLQINGILYYDITGNYYDGRWYNLRNHTMTEIPTALREYFTMHPDLVTGTPANEGKAGFILLPDGPYLVALHPVLRSNGEGPARGTIIMVRYYDDTRIAALQERAHIPVKMTRINEQVLRTDPVVVQLTAPGAPRILSSPRDQSTLVSSALIRDIDDKPILLMEVSSARGMYQQGMMTVVYLIAAFLVIAIIFVVMTELLLRRYIIAPLTDLDAATKAIGQKRDLSERLPVSGDDEIASLKSSLNSMLQELQDKEGRLARQGEQLAEANRKANLYLEIYLDVLTYEILNAMFALSGYVDLMEQGAGEKEKVYARRMVDTINKSRNVIRNIETISKIYKHPPAHNTVKFNDVVTHEIRKNPQVSIRSERCEVTVLADEMLEIVFDNLISNSLRFGGPAVEIVISVRELPDGMAEVSVTDTGPGIPAAVKPAIFDRFMQGSEKRSSYGLGLHIVKMLVEAYGGRIWADDRVQGDPGQGAAIRFTIKKA